MILTVTANPSLDYLFEAESLVWDDANRLATPRRRPGGQGINVVRAARALGVEAVALALLGGPTGDEMERILRAEGTPLRRISIDGDTRIFVGVRERGGRNLLLNPRGPGVTLKETAGALEAVGRTIDELKPAWVACCGSLAPGLPAGFYRGVGDRARDAGARFVIDCDGEALASAAPIADLLVPNQHEASRLLGSRIDHIDDAANAVRELSRRYGATAAITMGEEGALLSSLGQVHHARPEPVTGGSAVGAGDAFLAALLAAMIRGRAIEDVIGDAVAAGTAALSSRGADLLCVEDYERARQRIRVRRLVEAPDPVEPSD